MKRCPTCNRTYADDGFTFCLSDGALLSASYDPGREKPVSTIQNNGPPPTAVLPSGKPTQGDERAEKDSPLPPTIASPAAEPRPYVPREPLAQPARRRSRLLYLSLVLLVLGIGVGAISMYLAGRAQCPQLTIQCTPYENTVTCDLVKNPLANNLQEVPGPAICSLDPVFAFQTGALPQGVTSVTWSSSAGPVKYQGLSSTSLDTTGLSGKEITVKAAYQANGVGCSKTVSTSFIGAPSLAPKLGGPNKSPVP